MRTEKLGAVPGDQGPPAQPPKGLAQRRFGQQRFQLLEAGRKQRRIGGIEHVADVIVGWNLLDSEQAGAVGTTLAFF